MVGMRDVAKEAGVSLSTVSLVVNKTGYVSDDMRARELREQQVEARRLLESTASALASDGDLLTEAERAEIDRLASELGATLSGSDVERVKAALAALTKGTELFAERRMDRSIRSALAGKSVDDAIFSSGGEDPLG